MDAMRTAPTTARLNLMACTQTLPKTYDELRTEQAARQAKALLIEQEKMRGANRDKRLQQVPRLFRGKSFADFEAPTSEKRAVKRIAEQFTETFTERLQEGTSLLMHGKPGTGKTFLSLLIYQALVHQDTNVEYQSSLNFLRDTQERKFESFSAFQNVLNHYRQLPLLILDEVTEGSGKSGSLADWERSILFAIIDARYQEKHCTIVITNRSKEAFTERLGVPVADRLLEQGILLGFSWESYRQQRHLSVNHA